MALEPNRNIDQLHHTRWTMREGAPGEIFALAQTPDGFLWLGSSDGLIRFDGVRFEAWQAQEFRQRSVYSLMAARDGSLWVGFLGGGLARIDHGQVRNFTASDAAPTQPVLAFREGRDGTVWAAAGNAGLYRYQKSTWTLIEGKVQALSLFEDSNGDILLGAVVGMHRARPGSTVLEAVAPDLSYVMGISTARDKTMWVTETSRSVHPLGEGPRIAVGAQTSLFDRDGGLWIASLGDGVVRVREGNPARESFTEKQGLSHNRVLSLHEDREGNIWVGTNAGLDRFRRSPVLNIPFAEGWGASALAPAPRTGVWVGSLTKQLLAYADTSGVSIAVPDRLQNSGMYRHPDGSIWIATYPGLVRLGDQPAANAQLDVQSQRRLPSGQLLTQYRLPPAEGFELSPQWRARNISVDTRGRVWLTVSGKGTYRVDRSGWTPIVNLGGPARGAEAVTVTPEGDIVFGYKKGKLAIVKDDALKMVDVPGTGDIFALASRDKRIWIGGEEGLACMENGHAVAVGPAFHAVTSVLDTGAGGLWFGERRGIVHVPVSRCTSEPLRFRIFDAEDGLRGQPQRTFVSPGAAIAEDGRVWFATTAGLASLDPSELTGNPVPPPISITGVEAGSNQLPVSRNVVIPPSSGTVRVSYTALSLGLPERVRFRYQLEDSDWVDAGARREAVFTNLAPGAYHLRVIAANDSGVWNEAGAVLELNVLPAWYQTAEFRALAVLTAGALIWLLYRYRIRQLSRRFQVRMDARIAERERIARELHDTLLQGFQGLMLRLEAVKLSIPQDQPAHNMLEQTLVAGDRALVEGRDRVTNLRTANSADLPRQIHNCGEELAQAGQLTFQLAVLGTPRPLNPLVHDEAFQIIREALLNAFHHSGGTAVEAEITFERTRLRVSVRDDGKGIPESILTHGTPGHWGLSGMRERASGIDATLNFWSREGSGTEVELVLPARHAYA